MNGIFLAMLNNQKVKKYQKNGFLQIFHGCCSENPAPAGCSSLSLWKRQFFRVKMPHFQTPQIGLDSLGGHRNWCSREQPTETTLTVTTTLTMIATLSMTITMITTLSTTMGMAMTIWLRDYTKHVIENSRSAAVSLFCAIFVATVSISACQDDVRRCYPTPSMYPSVSWNRCLLLQESF